MGSQHPPAAPGGLKSRPESPQACTECEAALAALRIDVDVLMRLTMVVASVAAKMHGPAFKAALLGEYRRLSMDIELAPGPDQALVMGLLSEIVGELE